MISILISSFNFLYPSPLIILNKVNTKSVNLQLSFCNFVIPTIINSMKYLQYLLFLPLMLFCSCIGEEEPSPISLEPGDKCPTFSVTMSDGSTISTSELHGHKSMIVFFNTSCSDCREELPIIQQIYKRISEIGSDAQIICIARGEERESIERFWKENCLTLPYSPQNDREIYNLFASSIIPRIYILSPDLTITQCWDDNPMPSFEQLLNALR